MKKLIVEYVNISQMNTSPGGDAGGFDINFSGNKADKHFWLSGAKALLFFSDVTNNRNYTPNALWTINNVASTPLVRNSVRSLTNTGGGTPVLSPVIILDCRQMYYFKEGDFLSDSSLHVDWQMAWDSSSVALPVSYEVTFCLLLEFSTPIDDNDIGQ